MFRKPKRKVKESLRRKASADEESSPVAAEADTTNNEQKESDDEDTNALLNEARKRVKQTATAGLKESTTAVQSSRDASKLMHSFSTSTGKAVSNADLATRVAEHHAVVPTNATASTTGKAEKGADGIFRDTKRNKFLAGPIRAAQNVRVTARFDYQPDICKDYKDTGFCGFGDTCIYLHDRGDTLTGWQLEQQWEEQQKQKKEKQEKELQDFVARHGGGNNTAGDSKLNDGELLEADDGLPFACYLCREYFKEPVVTNCGHYFCQKCILDHVKSVGEACPICSKDTFSVFNQPIKLLAKKRKILGVQRSKSENSWEEFYKELNNGQST